MYGQKAEDACIGVVKATGGATGMWSTPSCRTFHSVVEEFFNMRVSCRAVPRRAAAMCVHGTAGSCVRAWQLGWGGCSAHVG